MARIEGSIDTTVILDTTLTEDEIEAILDGAFNAIKIAVRTVISADNVARGGGPGNPTTITGWHFEKSTGSVDEPES